MPSTPDKGPERPSSPCDSMVPVFRLLRNQEDTRRFRHDSDLLDTARLPCFQ